MLNATVAERPGFTTMELCGGLGGLAGVILGQAISTASADMGGSYLDALAVSFRAALYKMREKGWAVN